MQRQQSLDRHVHGGHVGRLEHDLRHVFSVGLEIRKSILGQDGMVFRSNPERAVPNLLHVILVGNGTVLSRHALALLLITDVAFLWSMPTVVSGILGLPT